MIPPLDECCTTCVGCGRIYCRDEDTSPGEIHGLCWSCFETEVDE